MAYARMAEEKEGDRMAGLEAVPAAEGREQGPGRNDAGSVDGKVAHDRAEAGAAMGEVVDIQPREEEALAAVVLGVDSTWEGDLGSHKEG